jgi:periplasmic mercuric ion binding protein
MGRAGNQERKTIKLRSNPMKIITISMAMALAMAVSARAADVTDKLTDVHICCQSCVKGAQKVIATVPNVKGDVSEDDEIITLTAPDTATVQKAVDALLEAGFYGKCSDSNIKISSDTGAKGQKVKTMTITGLHLCCKKCVTAVNKTVSAIPGVTGNTAAVNAKSFDVTGDFNDKDVMDALQKAGLTGKVTD